VSSESLVTIRAKSRTGDIYVRHARFFPHDKWITLEVPAEIASALAKDPWLDVRGLPVAHDAQPAAAAAVRPDGEVRDRELTAALARIDALERELARALAAHAQELERVRDGHARELDEVRRRTERDVRDAARRQGARDAEPRPPERRSPEPPARKAG
jgi:hypothetical protein